MKNRKLLAAAVALAVAARTRVPLVPGWVVPVPAVALAIALAAVTALALVLILRLCPARPVPVVLTAAPKALAAAVRRNCTYCGNTGTVAGDWCPVCHPNGGNAR